MGTFNLIKGSRFRWGGKRGTTRVLEWCGGTLRGQRATQTLLGTMATPASPGPPDTEARHEGTHHRQSKRVTCSLYHAITKISLFWGGWGQKMSPKRDVVLQGFLKGLTRIFWRAVHVGRLFNTDFDGTKRKGPAVLLSPKPPHLLLLRLPSDLKIDLHHF